MLSATKPSEGRKRFSTLSRSSLGVLVVTVAHTSSASLTAAELISRLLVEEQALIIKLKMTLKMKRAQTEMLSLLSGARQTAQSMLSLQSLKSTFETSALTPIVKAS